MSVRLEILLKQARACQVCEPALPHGCRPLIQGSRDSRLLLISQAPGAAAHESGVPWDDRSGDRLREWLGVSKDQFYDPALVGILPMGFCYPGKGNGGDLKPRPECAPMWHPKLLPGFERVRLTIFIGRCAFDRYLSDRFESLTAAVHHNEGLLPERAVMPHPSPRNNIWLKRNGWFQDDVLPLIRHRVKTVLSGSLDEPDMHRLYTEAESEGTSMAGKDIQEAYQAVVRAKEELLQAVRRQGPEPVEDWELLGLDGEPVRLSQLFGEHNDLLLVHNMGRGCNYCTLWADGFRGYVDHLERRCAFTLCSNDPPEVAKAFRVERGWNYRVVSGAGSEFARAMGYADESGRPHPGVSSFHRNPDDSIVRIAHMPFGPGDDFCPVWPLFDLLKEGKGGFKPV